MSTPKSEKGTCPICGHPVYSNEPKQQLPSGKWVHAGCVNS